MDEGSNISNLDLYSDLIEDNFREKEYSYEKLNENHKTLQTELKLTKDQLAEAILKNAQLEEEALNLKKNFSSLLLTAKAELDRKNSEIHRLRSCLDSRNRRQSLGRPVRIHDRLSRDHPIESRKRDARPDRSVKDGRVSTSHSTRNDHNKDNGSQNDYTSKSKTESVEKKVACSELKNITKSVESFISTERQLSDEAKNETHVSNSSTGNKSVCKLSDSKRDSDTRRNRSRDRIDVSKGRLDGKQVKKVRVEKNSSDHEDDRKYRNRRSHEKENVSKKRRHISESQSSPKRQKSTASPGKSHREQSSLIKYLRSPKVQAPKSEEPRQKNKKSTSDSVSLNSKDLIDMSVSEGKDVNSKVSCKGNTPSDSSKDTCKSLEKSISGAVTTKSSVLDRKEEDRAKINRDISKSSPSKDSDLTNSIKSISGHENNDHCKAVDVEKEKWENKLSTGTAKPNETSSRPFAIIEDKSLVATNSFDAPIQAEESSTSLLSTGNSESASSVAEISPVKFRHKAECHSCLSSSSAIDSSSCSSVDTVKSRTQRQNSGCTVTSTTLWETHNGVTTWVQGVEYVNGVRKLRLKPASSLESLATSSKESVLPACTPSGKEGNSIMDDSQCSVHLETESNPLETESRHIIETSPFKTPSCATSLDRIVDTDELLEYKERLLLELKRTESDMLSSDSSESQFNTCKLSEDYSKCSDNDLSPRKDINVKEMSNSLSSRPKDKQLNVGDDSSSCMSINISSPWDCGKSSEESAVRNHANSIELSGAKVSPEKDTIHTVDVNECTIDPSTPVSRSTPQDSFNSISKEDLPTTKHTSIKEISDPKVLLRKDKSNTVDVNKYTNNLKARVSRSSKGAEKDVAVRKFTNSKDIPNTKLSGEDKRHKLNVKKYSNDFRTCVSRSSFKDSVTDLDDFGKDRKHTNIKNSDSKTVTHKEKKSEDWNMSPRKVPRITDEASESLLSIPEDVYVFIGEESMSGSREKLTERNTSHPSESSLPQDDLDKTITPSDTSNCLDDNTPTVNATESVSLCDGLLKEENTLSKDSTEKRPSELMDVSISLSPSNTNRLDVIDEGADIPDDGEVFEEDSTEEGEISSDSEALDSPSKKPLDTHTLKSPEHLPVNDLRLKLKSRHTSGGTEMPTRDSKEIRPQRRQKRTSSLDHEQSDCSGELHTRERSSRRTRVHGSCERDRSRSCSSEHSSHSHNSSKSKKDSNHNKFNHRCHSPIRNMSPGRPRNKMLRPLEKPKRTASRDDSEIRHGHKYCNTSERLVAARRRNKSPPLKENRRRPPSPSSPNDVRRRRRSPIHSDRHRSPVHGTRSDRRRPSPENKRSRDSPRNKHNSPAKGCCSTCKHVPQEKSRNESCRLECCRKGCKDIKSNSNRNDSNSKNSKQRKRLSSMDEISGNSADRSKLLNRQNKDAEKRERVH